MDAATNSDRHNWSRLNRLQLGRYAEYLVKMEFVLFGCDVFSSEVDDHGIDFVIRTRTGNHYDVQVKSFRLEAGKGTPYVFLQKSKFVIDPRLVLVLVQFVGGEPPSLWMIPSCVDGQPNRIFESRDYGEGKQSSPEWGLTLSKKKLALLRQDCSFGTVLSGLD
ncbi:MAG: DUF4365 domain-containing protein [Acidobacteria bacterium]|nr:DUF4365 domain-containing protein [Acidobacteriota bacterium]